MLDFKALFSQEPVIELAKTDGSSALPNNSLCLTVTFVFKVVIHNLHNYLCLHT